MWINDSDLKLVTENHAFMQESVMDPMDGVFGIYPASYKQKLKTWILVTTSSLLEFKV